MAYIYPESDPGWREVESVVAATPDGSHVNVTHYLGTFTNQPVTHHNKFGDVSKGDIVVEIPGRGWLSLVWFNICHIEPYQG
jgi:hypothetical protein